MWWRGEGEGGRGKGEGGGETGRHSRVHQQKKEAMQLDMAQQATTRGANSAHTRLVGVALIDFYWTNGLEWVVGNFDPKQRKGQVGAGEEGQTGYVIGRRRGE